MTEATVKELIQNRKSVRTYDKRRLAEQDLKDLKEYAQTLTNPFDIPVEFRFLDAKEHGVSSAVIVGADIYVAAKVERLQNFEIAYGYAFEKFCLYAQSIGVGSVMLAATISRSAFEKAMEVGANEVMPVASPLGYPAPKRSVRETLMRKALKADTRMPFEEVFFDATFDKPLSKETAGKFASGLEMARLAPSAGNKQPCRAVAVGDTVHFYKYKSMKDSALGDIQKVDIGIALAHFDLTMRKEGVEGNFVFDEANIAAPDGMQYIVSYAI